MEAKPSGTVAVSDDVQEKAAAALQSGRLDLKHRTLTEGHNACWRRAFRRGVASPYDLSLDPSGSLVCTCQARRLCHHVWAFGACQRKNPHAYAVISTRGLM